MKNSHPTGACPIRDVLCRLDDKWLALVSVILNTNGTMCFNDIRKTIDDISQRMLTITLRTLETGGLVQRRVYTEVPPRAEHCPTKTGRNLILHVEALVGWTLDRMTVILEHREGERK